MPFCSWPLTTKTKMVDVTSEHVESDEDREPAELSVSAEHREVLTREQFDRELVKRVSEINNVSEKHVASRRNVMLDMSELTVGPEDFSDG